MTSNHFARRVIYAFVLASILIVFAPSTASSQGIVDSLFGLFQRPARNEIPPPEISYARPTSLPDPLSESRSISSESRPIRDVGGPWVAYCVRLCDGYFFPLARSFSMSPAEQCRSFCPAAKTKVFGGNGINQSSAADGSRYANLDTALLYRTRTVNNCTCNGRDAFGVARLDVANDPTLRPGDIVAIDGGFAAYTGSKSAARSNSGFTPIAQYSGVSNDTRRKLSETKVLPARQAAAPPAIAPTENRSASRVERRAQLLR
jgi:hypothetical protein